MFDFIYTAIGTVLSWFNSWTGHYALALLLFALAFKILFLPFALKQQKNQIAMAKLRPKLMKIEKKYAGRNDQATLRKKQEEMMELQRQEGYSMFGGCLPMIFQMIIIIFLYNVIREPLTYICSLDSDAIAKIAEIVSGNAADQISLISLMQNASADKVAEILSATGFEISLLPNFTLWGMNLAATPSFTNISLLVLIPFLAAGFQWLSMFLSRKWMGNTQIPGANQDQQTQMSMRVMDITMPVMTLFFAFNFSGMLGLYWIYQSILGIVQQFVLAKAMPLPRYSAEELKEMEKAERDRKKAQQAAIKQQPKYKSLHYIDDEDYEELPEVKKNNNDQSTKKSGSIESGNLKIDKK